MITKIKSNKRKKSAFTIIEFLIYFTILTTLILVVVSVSFQVIKSKTKLETTQNVTQNARLILEKIVDSIHNAESINSPSIGQSSNSLSLSFIDNFKNPTIFDVSSGVLRIKEGGGAIIPISSTTVLISDIIFTNMSYDNTHGTIRIQLTVNSSSTSVEQEYLHTETFYTTATIR